MKTILFYFLIFTLLTFSCKDDSSNIENKKPSCNILVPENNEEILHGTILSAEVNAEDDNLAYVAFYINDIEIGVDDNYPYIIEWQTEDKAPGSYSLRVEATDDEGLTNVDELNFVLSHLGVPIEDIEGNTYSTVVIGQQKWMSDNLKVATYNDGNPINLVEEWNYWLSNSSGAYCWYENDKQTYGDLYGALYNHIAVRNGNLCPDGWHIPSEDEWKALEIYLGVDEDEANLYFFHGINEGSKLAGNSDLWFEGELTRDNEFGSTDFDAIPAGMRTMQGDFIDMEYQVYFWSSGIGDGDKGYYRNIRFYNPQVYRYINSKNTGLSVRCMKNIDINE
jgi:uncharacterized protein (TIGR02145 family)